MLASDLKPHPNNARLHPMVQVKALQEILGQVGWVQEVIVSKKSGFILNGHARVEICAARGETVPVSYVDLTPAEEKLVLAAFDPIGHMALVDDIQLGKLIADLKLDTGSELDAMLAQLLGEAQVETVQQSAAAIPAEGRTPRQLGDRKTQIKPVLYADQVKTMEEAIRLTGEINRGKAIVKICEFFVGAHE